MRRRVLLSIILIAITMCCAYAQTDANVDFTHANVQASFDPQLQKYGYLRNLGPSIVDARAKRDPEALAMLAVLLFQAEKQSSLKSPIIDGVTLLTEATSLAEAQKNAKALRLIAELWGDETFGPGDEIKRKKYNDLAVRFTVENKTPTCRLVVRNLSSHTADLYAGHELLGTIAPQQTLYLYVDSGETELSARAKCHPVAWGPNKYNLRSEFVWRLTP